MAAVRMASRWAVLVAVLAVSSHGASYCDTYPMSLDDHGYQLLAWQNPEATGSVGNLTVQVWLDPMCPDAANEFKQLSRAIDYLKTVTTLKPVSGQTMPAMINFHVHFFTLGFHVGSYPMLQAFTCFRQYGTDLPEFTKQLYQDYSQFNNKSFSFNTIVDKISTWSVSHNFLSSTTAAACIPNGVNTRNEYKRGLNSGVYNSPTAFIGSDGVYTNPLTWQQWLEYMGIDPEV
ncbi:uncharacterized protein MONBRDRAFT_33182 [Monosiga brevicollis MX1]|uniref:Thioredoxin-like fold domain-containing protein n=1 Tax=Monosiga brevicollis TaxID=81824 RepID=A9V3J8_MONBE|nr:uncharacterized protein MONBRDRAFT_33182 [Monosiga brevicollis MX1]EDQ87925.1 predicted protein [Monosiga brevicollis MX1]|eukprot:XP_001747458.1 hypothetical protein [Monosiga brevicollis MX1]